MKKFCLAAVFIILSANVFAEETIQNTPQFVLCNSTQTRCTIGTYTLRSNGKPLYVNGGIMCTSDKKLCTNGYSISMTLESAKRK